jgi:hypothetical protein
MDPRRLDALERLDRPGNLALQGADPGDVLHERGQAEGAQIVEEFVAGLAALRQALLGQQHAGLRGLPVADQHRRAVRADVERDAGILEHGAHPAHVVPAEAGIEGLAQGSAEIIGAEANRQEHREADQPEGDQASRTQLQDVVPKLLEVLATGHRQDSRLHRSGSAPAWRINLAWGW